MKDIETTISDKRCAEIWKLRMRYHTTSNGDRITTSHGTLAELVRRAAMTKQECDAEDAAVFDWRRRVERGEASW